MSTHHIKLNVNGTAISADVESRLLLVHFIRESLNLTGTHIGCDTSSCGACTVNLNGKAIKSCSIFAVQADGGELKTVEGLAQDGKLHPIQEGFHQEHGLQCGFCTPGMMIASLALLNENPDPSEEQIRLGIIGQPVPLHRDMSTSLKAVQYAAQKMRETEQESEKMVPA